MDFWQRPLSDLGLAGPDQGKGGKYAFVGPGQEAPAVEGAFVLRSPTFGVVFFYRALDPDPAKAEVLSKGVRIYPWAERDNPPATRYLTPDPDKIAKFINPPRGMEYWERLSAAIQREPVEDRDRFFMVMLMPLGIEKGKPFQPDERQKKILTEGAFVGEAMAKANSFDMRFPDTRYRPDALWDYVMVLDHAGLAELQPTRSARRLFLRGPGRDQGHAQQEFWSVTLYDISTRSLIDNKEERSDRSSRQDLVKNADGSVDLYFAPTAPKGFEKNWVQCLEPSTLRLSGEWRVAKWHTTESKMRSGPMSASGH